MVVELSAQDHAKVSAAIADAEAHSDGEILAVVTGRSDSYHDVALHWAIAVLVAVLAWFAAFPACLEAIYKTLLGAWSPDPTLGQLLSLLLVIAVVKFLIANLLLRWWPLRMFLTPPSTKDRRVRRRAIEFFKTAAEARTAGRTGVLIYVSVAEHRAEIVADEAIHKVTSPEVWADAMVDLLALLKQGQPADGMVAAIRDVGEVLAQHFPKSSTDTNEIPDKLIEL